MAACPEAGIEAVAVVASLLPARATSRFRPYRIDDGCGTPPAAGSATPLGPVHWSVTTTGMDAALSTGNFDLDLVAVEAARRSIRPRRHRCRCPHS